MAVGLELTVLETRRWRTRELGWGAAPQPPVVRVRGGLDLRDSIK